MGVHVGATCTIVRGGFQRVCHQEWRRGLFRNYFGQYCSPIHDRDLICCRVCHKTYSIILNSVVQRSEKNRELSLGASASILCLAVRQAATPIGPTTTVRR